jgi:hypothetical protein
MGYKAIGTDIHQFANKRMGLNPAVVPDDNAFLYFNERADKAVIADAAFIEVNGFDDGNVFTEHNAADTALFDNGLVLHSDYQKLLRGV